MKIIKKNFFLIITCELKCQILINLDQIFIRLNLPWFNVIKSPHIFDSSICITYLIGKLLGYSDENICKYVRRVNYNGQPIEEQKKFAYEVLDRLCHADQ